MSQGRLEAIWLKRAKRGPVDAVREMSSAAVQALELHGPVESTTGNQAEAGRHSEAQESAEAAADAGTAICGSTVRVQLHHVQPDSLGGPTTVESVRVLCGSHNQLAARRVFGEAIVDLFARGRAT